MSKEINLKIAFVAVSACFLALGAVVQAELPEPVGFWRFEGGLLCVEN